MLVEVANAQAHTREQQVLRRSITSLEAALEQEFLKGEAAGIRALLAIPNAVVESARAIEEAQEESNETQD